MQLVTEVYIYYVSLFANEVEEKKEYSHQHGGGRDSSPGSSSMRLYQPQACITLLQIVLEM